MQLRSKQSIMLVSISSQILCSWIQTKRGRVSSPHTEFGKMASSALRTSSCVTV